MEPIADSIHDLFHKMVKPINGSITREQSDNIYEIARFIVDVHEAYKLKILKNAIERTLKISGLKYCNNVLVDTKTGFFTNQTDSVNIDFVIFPANRQNVYNTCIHECVVINCKRLNDGRMNEDNVITKLKPLKYYIATTSSDYPMPGRQDDVEIINAITDETMRSIYDMVNRPREQMKYIDLCPSLGSFHYSIQHQGINAKCILTVSESNIARKIYENNYKITPMDSFDAVDFRTYNADIVFIHEFQACRHDVLTCIISLEKFNVLVLENDDNLLFSNTECFIMRHLKQHNYKVITKILTCSDYGIPQHRRHAFMVCLHSGKFEKDITFYEHVFDYILRTRKDTTKTLTECLHNGLIFEMTTALRIRHEGNTKKWRHDEYKAVNKQGKQFMYTLSINDIKRLQGFDNNYALTGTKGDKKMLLSSSIPTNLSNIIVSFIDSIY